MMVPISTQRIMWGVGLGVAALALSMTPRAISVVAPVLLIVSLVAWHLSGNTNLRPRRDPRRASERMLGYTPAQLALALLAVFALWAICSASWSPVWQQSILKGGYLALLTALLWGALIWPPVPAQGLREYLALVFVAAMCSIAVLLAIEVVTDQGITRWLLTELKFLRPNDPKHIHVQDGVVIGRTEAELNRRMALLTLCLCPVAFAAAFWIRSSSERAAGQEGFGHSEGRPRQPLPFYLLLVVGAGSAAAAIFASGHQSSQTALIAAIVAYLLARYWPRLAIASVGLAWTTVVALIVPLAIAAFDYDLHRAPWLFHSARHRVVIWHETAHRVSATMFVGVGADATPTISRALTSSTRHDKAGEFPISLGRHAHNVYLQVWYELGTVGAALMLSIGLLMLQTIWRFGDGEARSLALAHFAAISTMLASSYGLWQAWFQASVALSVYFVMVLIINFGSQPPRQAQAAQRE